MSDFLKLKHMPITKLDLNKALLQQQKNIILEISKFLEKHVIEPIFDLKKDVGVLNLIGIS